MIDAKRPSTRLSSDTLGELTVVGRVEAFNEPMGRLAAEQAAAHPAFAHQAVIANTSAGKEAVELAGCCMQKVPAIQQFYC